MFLNVELGTHRKQMPNLMSPFWHICLLYAILITSLLITQITSVHDEVNTVVEIERKALDAYAKKMTPAETISNELILNYHVQILTYVCSKFGDTAKNRVDV
jgi:hypothetical protein